MKTRAAIAYVKAGLQYELTYRSRAFIWSLQSILWVFLFPFIWIAVYGDRQELYGFTTSDIITYFLLLLIMEYLVESYVDSDMHEQIRDGEITNLLVKPFDFVWSFFFSHMGYRIVRVSFFGLAIVIGYILFRDTIVVPQLWYTPLLIGVAVLIGHFLSFNLKVMVGCIAFWIEEAEPFRVMYWFVFGMLMGWVGPLDFFPQWVQQVSMWLPWQYTLYFPIMIYLESISVVDIFYGFAIGGFWLILLTVARKVVVRKSIQQYNAVGR